MLPRSLPPRQLSLGGEKQSSNSLPTWHRPVVLLLGDSSLSFAHYLLRYWPEAPLTPASPSDSSTYSSSASSATTFPFTSMMASRPTIYCMSSGMEHSSLLRTDAWVKAHELAGHLSVVAMQDPLHLSRCFPPSTRFDEVVLSIQFVHDNVVHVLIPVFVSIAEVTDEKSVFRLVLGNEHTDFQWLPELMGRASVEADFQFEKQEDLAVSYTAATQDAANAESIQVPNGFRNGKTLVFVRRALQRAGDAKEEEKRKDLAGRLDRVRRIRDEEASRERAWEAQRHREHEKQRQRAFERERTPQRERVYRDASFKRTGSASAGSLWAQ